MVRRGKALSSRIGQVVVEMLLILPVFLTIVFSIMELGNMAFWVIVINHATYEVARIGAMTAIDKNGNGPIDVTAQMQQKMSGMLNGARVVSHSEAHGFMDRQAGITNSDLVVTTTYPVQLVFPLSSLILSSKAACPQGPGGGRCNVTTTLRMPIERPLYQ